MFDGSVDNSVLYSCLDPPSFESVADAERSLISLGALHSSSQFHGRITSLGHQLSRLSCDPSIGKMLIYGAMFRCVSTISAIAACITSKDLFLSSADVMIKAKVANAKDLYVLCFVERLII